MRVAIVLLVIVPSSFTHAGVAFGGNDWYLAATNSNCDTTCAGLVPSLVCDGDALLNWTQPTENDFEGFIDDFAGVSSTYCVGTYPRTPAAVYQPARPLITNPTSSFAGECHAGADVITGSVVGGVGGLALIGVLILAFFRMRFRSQQKNTVAVVG
ncbi:hypothetical protein KFE25_006836 [Diacronema lutheri]|uniref:Uncharacterized protein n=1 Tax=Diacronema lutheri TaxID=2081491 RepID=A0A8J6CCP5_DIALT|nr:hypothetical protein KFE25_006836 [Diacronema lutheri]